VTNIHRVAVGIGPDINQLELEAITGDKNKVIMVDSFKSLHKHLENISQIANGKSFLSCSSAAPLQEPGYSSLGNSVTHFVPENGDRPESPNFLILLTDGNTRRQSRSIPRSLNPHANHIFIIIAKPTDKIITEGKFVTSFHCVATGNPTLKITWTKDGKTVGEGDTLNFETNGTQSGEYYMYYISVPLSFASRPTNQT
ncbi:hypothetical protein pdam_00001441, partial [Pocillopora damicornis]